MFPSSRWQLHRLVVLFAKFTMNKREIVTTLDVIVWRKSLNKDLTKKQVRENVINFFGNDNLTTYHKTIENAIQNIETMEKGLKRKLKLKCIYHGCAVGLQCACSAHSACTGWLQNSNPSHCICGIDKLGINIHIDIPKMYIKRVCSRPAACLQGTCSLHRLARKF